MQANILTRGREAWDDLRIVHVRVYMHILNHKAHTHAHTHTNLRGREGHETHLTANVIRTAHLIRAAELKEGERKEV